MGIKVLLEKCTGCEQCLEACPFGAISMVDGYAVISDGCTLCGICVPQCDFGALVMEKKEEDTLDLSEFSGVWVFAEHNEGKLEGVSLELLGEGKKLAQSLQEELVALVLGDGLEGLADELFAHGADKVYLACHPSLRHFLEGPYTQVLTELVNEHKPNIFLLGASSKGRSLAPRLAARLKTGLTADCTGLTIDPETKNLQQTRPAFGGNLMATIICPNHRPQMATVRPGVFQALARDEEKKGKLEIVDLKHFNFDLRAQIIEKISQEVEEKIDIEGAEVIVAGGRGMGEAKNFKLLEDLAKTLGGVVGATRAAVDAKWISSAHQIGQTGKTVAPKIYFACGIHGAVQHLVGMQSSDIIIAINKNPQAPIFRIATYGLVGDALEIIPLLTEELQARIN